MKADHDTAGGVLAIRMEPVAAQATTAIHNDVPKTPKPPSQREGTKQALLIAMRQG
jgi:hypothetical protein